MKLLNSLFSKELAFLVVLFVAFVFGGYWPDKQAFGAEENAPSSAHIIYHYFDPANNEIITAYSDYTDISFHGFFEEQIIENGQVGIKANHFPNTLSVSTDNMRFRVMLDYSAASGMGITPQDITTLAYYDAATGIVTLPGEYSNRDITIIWYCPGSEAVYLPVNARVSKTLEGSTQVSEVSTFSFSIENYMTLKLFDDTEESKRITSIEITQGSRKLGTSEYTYTNGYISLLAPAVGGDVDITITDGSEAADATESILDDSEVVFVNASQDENGLTNDILSKNENVPSLESLISGDAFDLTSLSSTSEVSGSSGSNSSDNSDSSALSDSDASETPSISSLSSSLTTLSASDPLVGERFAITKAQIRNCSEPNSWNVFNQMDHNGEYGFVLSILGCEDPDVVNAGNKGNGGIIYGGESGKAFDYNWTADYYWLWADCYGDVDDNGAGQPSMVSGYVEVKSVNRATGIVNYYFQVDCEHAATSRNMQTICGYFSVKKDFGGYIAIQKSSANASITSNNANYSLESAVYGVYSDSACTSLVTRLTTDSKGYAITDKLDSDTYYLKEITAPKGYALDTKSYSATITAGNTSSVPLTDTPQSNPVTIAVSKVDSAAKAGSPQGDASLAGAEFTLTYYDGYYASKEAAIASGSPTKTWVLKTDEKGEASLDESHKISGSAFYYNSSGKVAVPLGTLLIQETKAPFGYNLDNGSGGAPQVFLQQITSGGSSTSTLNVFNSPQASNSVIRGDFSLMKFIENTGNEADLPDVKLPAENVTFEIINSASHSVTRPDGSLAAPGEQVLTITTDKEGYAATENKALAFGSYLVQEKAESTPSGYSPVEPFLVTISEQGRTYRYILENKLTLSAVKVIKLDGETNSQIPAFVTYQLLNADQESMSFTTHYPHEEIHDTFTADLEGYLTFPERLPAGIYYLKEIQAPEGYALTNELLKFEIAEANNWDNPAEVYFVNNPIKGQIEISKTDSFTHEMVEGAEYSVRSLTDIVTGDGTVRAQAGDIVTSGVLTDEKGNARIEGLYLGVYTVYETKAPKGYALDTREYEVALTNEGQETPLVTTRLDTVNKPTTLEIIKSDKVSGEPLEGVTYRIWEKETGAALSSPELTAEDAFDRQETLDTPNDQAMSTTDVFDRSEITDEEGRIMLSYLYPGTYYLQEIQPLEGYLFPDEASLEFTVDQQGQIQGGATFTVEQTNDYTKVDISKLDLTNSEELPGASLTLTNEEGTVVADWVSSNTPHRIDMLAPGNYTLEETSAPGGYLLTESIDFEVTATGEIQQVIMYNEQEILDLPQTGDSIKPTVVLFCFALLGAIGVIAARICVKR